MTDQEIVRLLKLEEAPEALQSQVLEDAKAIAEMRVIGLVSEVMTEEQQVAFDEMSKNASDKEVIEWISREVANFEELLEAALKDYIEEKTS